MLHDTFPPRLWSKMEQWLLFKVESYFPLGIWIRQFSGAWYSQRKRKIKSLIKLRNNAWQEPNTSQSPSQYQPVLRTLCNKIPGQELSKEGFFPSCFHAHPPKLRTFFRNKPSESKLVLGGGWLSFSTLLCIFLPLLKLKREDHPPVDSYQCRNRRIFAIPKISKDGEIHLLYIFILKDISQESKPPISISNEWQTRLLACRDVLHLCGLLSPKNV